MEIENTNVENHLKIIKRLILYSLSCSICVIFLYYSIKTSKNSSIREVKQYKRFLTENNVKFLNNSTYSPEIYSLLFHNNYTQQAKKFYEASSKNIYKGTWRSSFILPNMDKNQGVVTVEMSYIEYNQSYSKIDYDHFLFTYFQLLDGETIDKWIEVRLHGMLQMNATKFDFVNKTVNGTDYFTSISFGEVLDRKNQYFCNSNIFYSYSNNNLSLEDGTVESLKGILQSNNCNFSIEFEVHLIKDQVEESKFFQYFLLVTSIASLQIISSMLLLNRINKYQSNSNYVILYLPEHHMEFL